jgi:hypothetical protein
MMQCFGSVFIFSGSGSRGIGSRSIRIRIQQLNNITAAKIFFFFKSKTAIYLSLGLYKVCPSYKRGHPTHDFFLLLWVILALLDPDSEYGSGSTGPIEYGFNPDPDPLMIRIRNTAMMSRNRFQGMKFANVRLQSWNFLRVYEG